MSGAAVLLFALALPATAQTYFPPALSKPSPPCGRPIVDDFTSEWYSKHLAAAREPSIPASANKLPARGTDVLRFTWLRSFDRPIIIRILWAKQRRPRLIAKELSGAGGYEPGIIARSIDRPLTSAEVVKLRAAMENANLSHTAAVDCDSFGLDGAQWVFEAAAANRYRFFDRWSPKSGSLRDLGLTMLSLTGWRVGDIY